MKHLKTIFIMAIFGVVCSAAFDVQAAAGGPRNWRDDTNCYYRDNEGIIHIYRLDSVQCQEPKSTPTVPISCEQVGAVLQPGPNPEPGQGQYKCVITVPCNNGGVATFTFDLPYWPSIDLYQKDCQTYAQHSCSNLGTLANSKKCSAPPRNGGGVISLEEVLYRFDI